MKKDSQLEAQITHDPTVTKDKVKIRDKSGVVRELEDTEDEDD